MTAGAAKAGGTRRQKEMRKALRASVPRIPFADAEPVLAGALAPHLRHLPPSVAVWLALVAHVRHAHSDYDALLDEGYERDAARYFALPSINDTLLDWGSTRQVTGEEEEIGED
ncbi:DUF2293 domain-containing protein [Stappia sp. P2PMeth1]|uniref:DUF2293 domain-containing protein n=1 Tax=Stappia sp. P2PMeth1 TaxID=2003586 RepID=UPI0016483476|nr:DUF2293 domain-containing protein [Stappia sp. P2PMeth1]